MTPIYDKATIANAVKSLKDSGQKIGFVPTMGALHKGHTSLIDFGLQYCDVVVVSIFVNPTQFNNHDDLKKYPRTLDDDIKLLAPYHKQVMPYVPNIAQVYDNKPKSKKYAFGSLATAMEGRYRPGHFDGVGTVLNLLFRQIMPHMAFFGEKDYQQLLIVKKMVKLERLPVQIVGSPIYRQRNGLAMSSRNARLTNDQLNAAPLIFQVLKTAQKQFESKSAAQLKSWVTQQFNEHPILDLEYFEIANIKNLNLLSRKRKHQKYRAFIAAFAGEVRLIDNIALN